MGNRKFPSRDSFLIEIEILIERRGFLIVEKHESGGGVDDVTG